MMKHLRKCMAKILAVSLMAALIIGFVPQISEPVYAGYGYPAMVYGSESVLKKTVWTGAPQNQMIWYANEPWYVISYDSYRKPDGGNYFTAHSGVMTLFAFYSKATGSFNRYDYDIDLSDMPDKQFNDYEGSHLKTVVDDWFTAHFSDEEKKAVVERELEVDEYNEDKYGEHGIPYYSKGVSGTATSGYLWPLSTAEAIFLHPYIRQGVGWWLRSPGDRYYRAAYVCSDGSVDNQGNDVNGSWPLSVCPAFWLDLESVLLTSAAEGGKLSDALGADALQAVGTNETIYWKLTLMSDSHSGFSVDEIEEKDGVYTVKYSGAKTGNNEYISAVIIDPSDNITYYGRIAEVSNASDSVEINTAGRFNNGDMLFVFNEQYNGDKNTDYASGLKLVATYQSGNPYSVDRPISIADAEITGIKDVTYNGKARTQEIKVTLGDAVLIEGTDYEVTYTDNTNAGTAKMILNGINAYKDSAEASFTIKPASIKGAKVTPKKTSMVWTGKALKPGVKSVVLADGTELAATDYTVSYKNNTNAGTATIIVKGKGNYTGTATATFRITKAEQAVKSVSPTQKTIAAGKSFTLKARATKEQGTAQFKQVSQKAKFTVASNGKVTVKKGIKAGKYTVKYRVRIKKTQNCKTTKYVTKSIVITVK